MNWKRIKGFCGILVVINAVHGETIKTQLVRSYGEGSPENIKCASDAGHNSILAKKMDASNTCTNLDWGWGAAPNYESGSTYFEKKHVIETYETPVVPERMVTLPILFAPGAYIDMYVEFTSSDFNHGVFQMIDTLDGSFDIYSGDEEIVMVHMLMKPTEDYVRVKTYYRRWVERVNLQPYPFTVGRTYKLTFKALATDMQVLVDDNEIARYNHYTPPQNARILMYPHTATLLHKVEFVGV